MYTLNMSVEPYSLLYADSLTRQVNMMCLPLMFVLNDLVCSCIQKCIVEGMSAALAYRESA